MSAYAELMDYVRVTEALAEVAGRLGWDQETVMPRGAAPQRAEEMAAMEGVLHARRIDPRVGEWLAAAEPATDVERANLRLVRRAHERTARVPARLASEIARVTSTAQGVWAEARAAEDFAAFAPVLAEVLRLKREEAHALARGGDLYDALLDGYEPGATAAELRAMFGALRPRLVALRERLLGAPRPERSRASSPRPASFASRPRSPGPSATTPRTGASTRRCIRSAQGRASTCGSRPAPTHATR